MQTDKSTIHCPVCQSHLDDGFYFSETGTAVFAYPKDNLIHVHFGESTWKEDLALAEVKWMREIVFKEIYEKHPGKIFFTTMDLTRKDNSEFLSRAAMDVYKQIGLHEQSGPVAQYGASRAMREVVKIIMKLARVKRKIYFVEELKNAEKRYKDWMRSSDLSADKRLNDS